MKRFIGILLAVLGVAAPLATAEAQTRDKVLFVLDWVVFGRHTPYFAALEKGFFTASNIDATIQLGYGSAATVKRLGAGQADFIFADFGALVLARANEGLKAKMVAMGYGKNGHAVFYLESSGIRTPKDLVGKRIAGAPGASVTALFPGFLRANGVDPGSVRVINVDAQALNPVLLSKQADAMLEFNFNQVGLEKQGAKDGLKPNHFMYADHNFGFYANGIIVRDEMIALLRAKPGSDVIEVILGDFAEVEVEQDFPLGRVVQARQQFDERGLARPVRADQRDLLPGLDAQIDAAQGVLVVAGVAERDVPKLDAQADVARGGQRPLGLHHLRLEFEKDKQVAHEQPVLVQVAQAVENGFKDALAGA